MSGAQSVVFYDGVCGLCNRLIQFVLKRDDRGAFKFAALQSGYAAETLEKYGKDPADLDTFYLLADADSPDERLLCKSTAGLEVLKRIGGVWAILSAVMGIFPRAIRDAVYDMIVRNRYEVFGKFDACPIPTPEQRARFIEM